MTRAEDTRAASLALALPPRLEATTAIDSALGCLPREPLGIVVVARRGRLIGGLTRGALEHAVAFGLGGLSLADLLVADLQTVAPNASPASVWNALNASPSPFILVRASGARPSGFIDRPRLAALGRAGPRWKGLSSRGPARVRTALRRRLSAEALRALEELGRRASGGGGRACLVGGGVRDLLLDRPTRDLDLIVEGELRALTRGLGRLRKTHARFRTATLELDDGTVIDVAHARSERYSRPALLPEVRVATVEADLARRDFTINTLALSIEPRSFGSVLDLCGATGDLDRRRIRVLHGLSFFDDPTRAFRAVRLAARLGFEIERRTARSMELALRKGIFDRLSSARLRRELECLLTAPEFPSALRLAARHGLVQVLSPALGFTSRTGSRLARSAPAIDWYEGLERSEVLQRWLVPLGLLLQDSEPRVVGEVLDRLRPDRRAVRVLRRCGKSTERLIAELARQSRPTPSRVYFACKGLEVEILLMAIACAPRKGTRNAIRRHLEIQREIRLEISGRDLLRAGVPAGPALARGLEAALAAKLDGRAAGAAEQLRVALLAVGDGKSPA